MRHHGVSFFAFVLAGLVLTAGWTWINDPDMFTLHSESKVWVEGTSSIHDWTCNVDQVKGSFVSADAASGIVPLSRVEVVVPVEEIACKNGTMNKKTYEALKSDEHPTIRYELDVSEVLSGSAADRFELRTTGHLTIAGVERAVEMTVTGKRLEDGRFRFSGQTPLLMTDYGIDPPRAMLGTLKTGDEVVVHFDVVAEPSNAR